MRVLSGTQASESSMTKSRHKAVACILLLSAVALLPAIARVETQEERGMAIAIEMDMRDSGFHDQSSEMVMILRNRHGEESIRDLRNRTLEVADDGDKSMIIFDRPRDVKGTAFLSFSHKTGSDDQWLYLPALKRVKRLSSNNKSGPFMGSEFAYEDIIQQELEKYTYKYLRDEDLDGMKCFVLERYPVDKKSGYTKQVLWVDQAEYRVHKIDFYDRKATRLKTLTFSDYRQYVDKFWRAHQMDMVNHQTGKSTTLKWSNYRFGNGFTDRDFDKNTLKRVR